MKMNLMRCLRMRIQQKPFWEEISEKAIAEGKRIEPEDKVLLEVSDKEEDCWKEVCKLK